MITFVTGCPCAGKTTYALKIRQNEALWDYDEMVALFFGDVKELSSTQKDTINGFYRAFLRIVKQNEDGAIIIKTKLSPVEREMVQDGTAVEKHLEISKEEALERAERDNRPASTFDSIEKYFDENTKGVKKMQKKSVNFEIKSVGDGESHSIEAYAATFHREPDSYGDVIRKGAFENTLKEWKESGNVIPLLFGHRMDDPLMNIGSVTSAEEDETGLKISATFDMENERGAYVYKLVKEKRLTKLSFAFEVLDEAEVTLEDGVKANELRELSIYEVSLVPVPANSHATVQSVKSEKQLDESLTESQVLRDIINEEINKFVEKSPMCYTQDSQADDVSAKNTEVKPEVSNDKGEEQGLLTAIDIELSL